jgi:hypothetical protein
MKGIHLDTHDKWTEDALKSVYMCSSCTICGY